MRRLSGQYMGILLKKYPHKHKIALLDKVLGRIDGIIVCNDYDLSLGSVLQYTLNEQRGSYFIVSYEVIEVPLLLGKHDLYFLHHVLELCYYSVRLGTVEVSVFDIIIFLYTHFTTAWSIALKKVFIFRLLMSIGFYTEHPFLDKPAIIHLYTTPIDKVFTGTIHLDYMQDIHDWICFCIAEHPYSNQFKTVNFLYKK